MSTSPQLLLTTVVVAEELPFPSLPKKKLNRNSQSRVQSLSFDISLVFHSLPVLTVPITIFQNGDADDEVDLPIIEIVEDVSAQPIMFEGRIITEDECKFLPLD